MSLLHNVVLFLVFYNFYYSYSKEENIKKSEFILKEQEDLFKNFLKKYDEKVILIESIISNFNNNDEIINFIENIIFQDKNISSFKVINLSAKESLKILNISNNKSEVLEYSQLRNLFATNYFKNMRGLNYKEIYHYSMNDNTNSMNFVIRSKDNFYSIKIDLNEIFQNIINKYPKKIFIVNNYNDYINSAIPNDLNKNEWATCKFNNE